LKTQRTVHRSCPRDTHTIQALNHPSQKMSFLIPPKTSHITAEDLNDPAMKNLVLMSINNLLEMGAALKRCEDSEWQDGTSWGTKEAADYELKKVYNVLKKAKPSMDVKVYVDSTDHRSGKDYIKCKKCRKESYLSVDEPAKCACECNAHANN